MGKSKRVTGFVKRVALSGDSYIGIRSGEEVRKTGKRSLKGPSNG